MAASCTYGTNPLFALPLFALGMNVGSVLFYRYFFAVLLFGLWLTYKKVSLKISLKDAGVLFFLGVMFSVSSLTLFMGYTYVGAGIASTILFVYPIFVAMIMALFFKEKISLKTVVSIVLMVAGIILFYKGDDGKGVNFVGILVVLVSAASYAVYMICLKKMPQVKHIHFPVLTFYVMLFGLLVFLLNLRFGADLQALQTPFMWACVLGAAIVPTIVFGNDEYFRKAGGADFGRNFGRLGTGDGGVYRGVCVWRGDDAAGCLRSAADFVVGAAVDD